MVSFHWRHSYAGLSHCFYVYITYNTLTSEQIGKTRRLKEEKEEVIRLLCEKLRTQTELEYDVALIKLEFQDEETMELADLELLDTAPELIYG